MRALYKARYRGTRRLYGVPDSCASLRRKSARCVRFQACGGEKRLFSFHWKRRGGGGMVPVRDEFQTISNSGVSTPLLRA